MRATDGWLLAIPTIEAELFVFVSSSQPLVALLIISTLTIYLDCLAMVAHLYKVVFAFGCLSSRGRILDSVIVRTPTSLSFFALSSESIVETSKLPPRATS